MRGLLVVGAVCGALLSVTAVIYGAYRLLRGVVNVEAALPTLMAIHGQFRPNGGPTLREALNEIETRAEAQQEQLDRIERAVEDK